MKAAEHGSPSLLVLYKETAPPADRPGARKMEFAEAKRMLFKRPASAVFRFREAILVSERLGMHAKPLFTALVLRALSRGACRFEDRGGRSCRLTAVGLLALLAGMVRDLVSLPFLLRRMRRIAAELRNRRGKPLSAPALAGSPLYLRTDFTFGIRSGGSVGHIAGVLNNLDAFCGRPSLLTTDAIPTVRSDIPAIVVPLRGRYLDFPEAPALGCNEDLYRAARKGFDSGRPAFIYQRYSVNDCTGARLARDWAVPLVLEYNGSEIWIARNWGKPLRYESLSEAIEMADLTVADLIVVVSRAMRDELTKRGVPSGKILVNPNGVDPEKYSPSVDGEPTRARLGLKGKSVVGFIGTFGRWHGAEVLAEAFGRLINREPRLAEETRLLLIGDGQMLPQVKEAIARHGIGDRVILTGLVPQQEGPAHLAACDILASPHVPNPDGTPFFGSPTKLFEYMAMGKAIVASDLDQIGEILSQGETGWMVKPGDPDSLAEGLRSLLIDPALRARLGARAREAALERHSWKGHTGKIIAALRERLA